MKGDFELVQHTADIGLRAYGIDLTQAFANAARGMFSVITDIEKINEVIYRDVEVAAPDRESLLVEWLNELVFLFDTEMVLFRRFHIEELTEKKLTARCYGEKIDRSRHELKRGIKAATYHMLKIEQENNYHYRIQVLFDV
jgi:SHS2 domain-containing protein